MLGGVGERFRNHEVGCRLDRRSEPLVELDGYRHWQAALVGKRGERRREAAIGEHGRMDAAGEVAELAERLADARTRLCDELPCARGIGCELLLGQTEAHSERDEPRLRTVVQVALDA